VTQEKRGRSQGEPNRSPGSMERQVTVGEMLNATKTETLANGCVQKVRGEVHVVGEPSFSQVRTQVRTDCACPRAPDWHVLGRQQTSGERVLGWGKRQDTPALKCTSLGCGGEALCSQSKSRISKPVLFVYFLVSVCIVPLTRSQTASVGRKTRSKPGGTPEQNYGGPIRN
jgi:hypothetical protein